MDLFGWLLSGYFRQRKVGKGLFLLKLMNKIKTFLIAIIGLLILYYNEQLFCILFLIIGAYYLGLHKKEYEKEIEGEQNDMSEDWNTKNL